MTKFVSKQANYMIVLKPGTEGNRALGTQAVSGLYIRFQDGVVDIKEESIVNQLREHEKCGTDFVEVKDEEMKDPYAGTRVSIEPQHVMTEIDRGYAGKKTIEGEKKLNLSPEMKKAVKAEALKMIPQIIKEDPEMLKSILKNMVSDAESKVETESTPEVLDSIKSEITDEVKDKPSETPKTTQKSKPGPKPKKKTFKKRTGV